MMGPLILIVLGVMFLLSNIFPQTFSFGRLWPVILIVIGVVKIVESLQKQKLLKKDEPDPKDPS